ncbi:M28 family metallopeptidase [Enhygromyxa salina]|uniref:M28 family metallopeptidase n=1 Tax=Enhygromyxa salina TaxID=215803 RepID=UPI0011B2766E|nr:M28 family peptidase [Enhygromyxa salina]
MRPALIAFVLLPTLVCGSACQTEPEPAAEPKPAAEAKPTPAPMAEPEPEPEPVASEAAAAIADEVDAARYAADLQLIAAPRPPGSPHWQVVQDRCLEVFEAAGFAATRFEVDGAGVSVVGRKGGKDSSLPELVIGAHYDHIEDCPGADDNASGTAAVLELARVLGAHEWERSITVACWDQEETGLHGSRAWVDAAIADSREIALYFNLDAIAYADSTPNSQRLPPGVDVMFAKQIASVAAREFRADFIAILADDGAHDAVGLLHAHATRLQLHDLVVEIPAALTNEPMLADLRRSDHANFWRHNVPCVFFSDTADFRADTYHCEGRPDSFETINLEFATKVVRAAAGAAAELL